MKNATVMKTKLYLAALCTAAMLATGCNKSNEPTSKPEQTPQVYEDLMDCYDFNDEVTLCNGKKPSELEWMKDYVTELLDREHLSTWMTFALMVKCPERDIILTHEELSSPYISAMFDCNGNRLTQNDLTAEEQEYIDVDESDKNTVIVWMNTEKLYGSDIIDRLSEYRDKNK